MSDEFLGRELYNAGWRQGTLLPALPRSVIYNVNDPLTNIAKTSWQVSNPNRRKPDGGITLARFANRMREWFDPASASLVAWEPLHLYEISAGDYINTQQIYLDHYTYNGGTIRGLTPPFYPS